MMKNRKGFMLAELVISATVVVSTMVGLYSLYSKLYNKYKERNSYYSVDAMYATKEMIDIMISNNEFSTFINRTLSTSSSGFIIENGRCTENPMECWGIQPLYGIRNMVIVEYSLCSLVDDDKCGDGSTPLINNNIVSNQTFKDYIRYLVTYYDIENLAAYDEKDSNYHYLVLTEIDSACDPDQANNSSSSNNSSLNGTINSTESDEGEIFEEQGEGDIISPQVANNCKGNGKTYYASMRIR